MDSLTVTVNPHAAAVSESGATLGANGKRKGRPPKYNNCLDLAWAIECYFQQCDDGRPRMVKDKNGRQYTEVMPVPYTKIGLAQFIGLSDDAWAADYGARGEDFSAIIKDALLRVELQRNEQLLTGEANTIGSIFLLKAHYGYRDTPEVADSRGITVVLNGDMFAAPKLVGEGSTALRGSVPLTLDVDMADADRTTYRTTDADDTDD